MSNKFSIENGMQATVECAGVGVPFDGKVKYFEEGFLSFEVDSSKELPSIENNTDLRIRIFDFDGKLTIYHGVLFKGMPKEWIIYYVEKWSVWERREFYRQDVSIKAKLSYTQGENGEEVYKEMVCTILDISAGGLRFSCQECDLLENAEVRIEDVQLLYNGITFSFDCKIVRVNKNLINNFYGCTFINMSERTQEKLIETIFKVQQRSYR